MLFTNFLWRVVIDKFYLHSKTIDDFKTGIHDVITRIKPDSMENVLNNWVDRIDYCQVSFGRHLMYRIFGYKFHKKWWINVTLYPIFFICTGLLIMFYGPLTMVPVIK